MTTPRFSMPELTTSQASKEITHNEALAILDAITQASVLDKDLATPPGSPSEGDAYIVASSPTGDWSGQAGKVAYYRSGWLFISPFQGMRVLVLDEEIWYEYSGSAWLKDFTRVISATIADDAVLQIDTGSSSPMDVMVMYPDELARILTRSVDLDTTATMTSIYSQQGSEIVAGADGALTGTTGVDGNVTWAAHDAAGVDGRFYLENRSGASITVAVQLSYFQ